MVPTVYYASLECVTRNNADPYGQLLIKNSEQHQLLLVLSDSMFQAVYSRARALSPGFFPSFPPNTALYYLKARKQVSTVRFQMIAIVCIELVVRGGECFSVL